MLDQKQVWQKALVRGATQIGTCRQQFSKLRLLQGVAPWCHLMLLVTMTNSSGWSEAGIVHGPMSLVVQEPHQPWRRKERLYTLHGQAEDSSRLGLQLLDDSCIKCFPVGVCVVVKCVGEQDRICAPNLHSSTYCHGMPDLQLCIKPIKLQVSPVNFARF